MGSWSDTCVFLFTGCDRVLRSPRPALLRRIRRVQSDGRLTQHPEAPDGHQRLQRVLLRPPRGHQPVDRQRADGQSTGEQRGGLFNPPILQVVRLFSLSSHGQLD